MPWLLFPCVWARLGSGRVATSPLPPCSMQLALDVQIPRAFGGLGARALYVDAEGGLTPERVRDMAAGLAAHLCRIAGAKGGAERQQVAAAVTVDALLRGIDYYRVHSLVEQVRPAVGMFFWVGGGSICLIVHEAPWPCVKAALPGVLPIQRC